MVDDIPQKSEKEMVVVGWKKAKDSDFYCRRVPSNDIIFQIKYVPSRIEYLQPTQFHGMFLHYNQKSEMWSCESTKKLH
jgi:hypothetical protein